MPHWTVDAPTTLDFDGVAGSGSGSSRARSRCWPPATGPALDVTDSAASRCSSSTRRGHTHRHLQGSDLGRPAGLAAAPAASATITLTVPRECPTQLGVVSATAVVSGSAPHLGQERLRGDHAGRGDRRDGADTVSGDVEAQGLNGRVGFNSVSGDLTVADGAVEKLRPRPSAAGSPRLDLDADGACGWTRVSGGVAIRLPSRPAPGWRSAPPPAACRATSTA